MVEDSKKLIKSLGIPIKWSRINIFIMWKDKICYCAYTEDMDTLCFSCPILIRDLYNKDDNVIQIELDLLLKGLNLNMDKFIDLCILCGCDYSSLIEGIGEINAYKLIKEHKNIENVLKYTKKCNKDNSHKKKCFMI